MEVSCFTRAFFPFLGPGLVLVLGWDDVLSSTDFVNCTLFDTERGREELESDGLGAGSGLRARRVEEDLEKWSMSVLLGLDADFPSCLLLLGLDMVGLVLEAKSRRIITKR